MYLAARSLLGWGRRRLLWASCLGGDRSIRQDLLGLYTIMRRRRQVALAEPLTR